MSVTVNSVSTVLIPETTNVFNVGTNQFTTLELGVLGPQGPQGIQGAQGNTGSSLSLIHI